MHFVCENVLLLIIIYRYRSEQRFNTLTLNVSRSLSANQIRAQVKSIASMTGMPNAWAIAPTRLIFQQCHFINASMNARSTASRSWRSTSRTSSFRRSRSSTAPDIMLANSNIAICHFPIFKFSFPKSNSNF